MTHPDPYGLDLPPDDIPPLDLPMCGAETKYGRFRGAGFMPAPRTLRKK